MLIHVPPEADVLAMDADGNSAGQLVPGSFTPVIDKISTDEESIRSLIGRFADPGRAWACYEAGCYRRHSTLRDPHRLAGPASTRPPELKPSPMSAADWATVIRVESRP